MFAAPSNERQDGEKAHFALLAPQCFVGLIDAVSFMVVAPSLSFYVSAMGGTKEAYGIILSVFSFASFMFKPMLGYWCDKSGCKFRLPYLFSIAVAAIGGLLYFFASSFTGSAALAMVFASRFLGGVGAANSTLGFTYIASVLPQDQMTKANAMLSMVRIIGMAAAPGLNVFLSEINGRFFSFDITPLNSIGLVLFVANILSFLVIYMLLQEPSEETRPNSRSDNDIDERTWRFWNSFLSLEIIVPITSILCLNANFQLLETGLAPASSHALNWGPIEISTVFGLNAVWIFLVLLLSFWLSSKGVTDSTMLVIGSVASTVGYMLMYLLWSTNTSEALFILPILVSTLAFPFLGAPTRSLFTKVVDSKEHLRNHQGKMQAALSMAASVAGFAAPGLIAAFVLRTPEQVEASMDHRELTPYALFAPISSVVVLLGVLFMCWRQSLENNGSVEMSTSGPGERTGLLTSQKNESALDLLTNTRRHSDTIMGIPSIAINELTTYRHTIAL
jgi:MFS transporter, ceroid-lipofuscinosis neuronal protein 7